MKIKKVNFITVLIAIAALLVPATQVLAGGEGGEPPDWEKVTGPEVWATAVVRCEPGRDNFIAFSVKRIKDCNVQMQGLVLYPTQLATACPDTSNPFLYERLDSGSIFPNDPDIPQNFKPIVTKIKNFTLTEYQSAGATATLTFNAQIKFVDEQ
jgi:hypothetical protein